MIQANQHTTGPLPASSYAPAGRLVSMSRVSSGGEEAEPTKPVNPVLIVLRTLRGRWGIAGLLAAILSVFGACAGYKAKQPVYVSGGTIQVFPNKTNILYADTDDSRLRLFDAFVAAELSYLLSNPVLERAITLPGMKALKWPADVEGAVALKKTLAVEKKGGLVTLTGGYRDPQAAASIVNSVLDAYSILHAEQLQLHDTVRERELTEREQDLLSRLNEFDAQILKIGREYGTSSIGMAHTRKISQAEEVDQRVADLELTIATQEAADSSNNVDIGDAEIKRLLVLDHAMADMLFERCKIAAELAVLETQHAAEHHLVIETKARLAVVDKAVEDRRNQLATLGTSGALTKTSEGGQNDSVADLKALRSRFSSRRDELQKEARELNERLIKLEFFRKERDESRILLDETRRALEQVRVESRHSLPGTVEVKSRGTVPATPATDKRVAFAAAGGVFGAIGGVMVTALYGFAFRRCRYSDDISSAMEVIGALPRCPEITPEAEEVFQHSIQRLRVELQLRTSPTPGGYVLAVTGVRSGAGSTTIAIALAQAFSEATVQTVLVDADFRDSEITRRLGLDHAEGVREALLDGHLNLQLKEATVGELRTLPLGNKQQLSDSHVSHRPLSNLLQQLKARCDLVILDLGPLPERLTARLGVSLADQVLCVVPANESAQTVEQTLAELNRLSPHRSLVVFNGACAGDPMLDVCDISEKSRSPVAQMPA